MNFTKTTTYALRILIFMANSDQNEFTASFLSETLKIQSRYLRRILTDLAKYGFIRSRRGKNGGFVFAKSLKEIYLADIVDAIEGIGKFKTCMLGNLDCEMIETCAVHDIFDEARIKMMNTLKTTSLFDLKNKKL
jgi:Rrf2 family transcriptional regulator, iron-sulfur cluster assembly transcription factor